MEYEGLDTTERELYLFITSDSELYRQQYEPILKNLSQKKYRGIYDHEKAVKLMMYLTESGAKKYYKEFGSGSPSGWHEMFTKENRTHVAQVLVSDFEGEFALGNYSGYKQKYVKVREHTKEI